MTTADEVMRIRIMYGGHPMHTRTPAELAEYARRMAEKQAEDAETIEDTDGTGETPSRPAQRVDLQ